MKTHKEFRASPPLTTLSSESPFAAVGGEEESSAPRVVGSGFHRIKQRGSAEPEPQSQLESPPTARRSSLPPAPATEVRPRWWMRQHATVWLATAIAIAAVAFHWFVHTPFGLTVVAFSPLFLMALRRADARSALQAGLLWVLLAWAELVHPLANADNAQPLHRLVALLVLAFILLRLRSAYTDMQELSRRDPLTGLLNRRGFEELASRELRRADRYGRPIAFALVDIDRFKHVNDRFGHAAGDRVLQLVAAQLSELRTSDFAVRLGGDEFGVLMPETDHDGAQVMMARLKQRVQEGLRAQGWPVTISVGVADNHKAARFRPMEALIAEADRRMYVAKALERENEETG